MLSVSDLATLTPDCNGSPRPGNEALAGLSVIILSVLSSML